MKKITFIKAGGSGNIIEEDTIPVDHPWLFYRKLNIDDNYFRTLIDSVGKSSKKYKIGLAVGGVGSFLFIKFAKQMGQEDSKAHRVGIKIINITSSILLNSFRQNQIKVFPRLVDVGDDLEKLFDSYNLVLFKASVKHWSTDSIVAKAASRFKRSKLIYFKTNIKDRVENVSGLTVGSLKFSSFTKRRPQPGFDPLIDWKALCLIEKFGIKTTICEKDLIGNLDNIIENDSIESELTIRL